MDLLKFQGMFYKTHHSNEFYVMLRCNVYLRSHVLNLRLSMHHEQGLIKQTTVGHNGDISRIYVW